MPAGEVCDVYRGRHGPQRLFTQQDASGDDVAVAALNHKLKHRLPAEDPKNRREKTVPLCRCLANQASEAAPMLCPGSPARRGRGRRPGTRTGCHRRCACQTRWSRTRRRHRGAGWGCLSSRGFDPSRCARGRRRCWGTTGSDARAAHLAQFAGDDLLVHAQVRRPRALGTAGDARPDPRVAGTSVRGRPITPAPPDYAPAGAASICKFSESF